MQQVQANFDAISKSVEAIAQVHGGLQPQNDDGGVGGAGEPLTLNPQPSTLNPQPSTLNPQPSTLNPQPSTLNPQPSTLNPQRRSRGGGWERWRSGCWRGGGDGYVEPQVECARGPLADSSGHISSDTMY